MNKKYRLTKLIALDEMLGYQVGDIKNIVDIFDCEGKVAYVDEYGNYFVEEQLEEVIEV